MKKRARYTIPSDKQRLRKTKRKVFLSHNNDLSEYEEGSDRSFLESIGIRAAHNAINENKALGIPITFWDNGKVVRRMPDGHIEPLSKQAISPQKHTLKAGKILKKGTILHVHRTTR